MSDSLALQYIKNHKDEYNEKYSRQWMLTEFRFGKPVAKHSIYLGTNYRDGVSYSYFNVREMEKTYGKKAQASGNAYTYCERLPVTFGLHEPRAAFELLNDAQKLTDTEFMKNPLPLIEHDSIWEFYKAIGYDYKKQKYLKE